MATKFSFSADGLGDAMNSDHELKLVRHSDHHGWNVNDNRAMEFGYKDYDFRLWRPDVSVCRNDAAILVSCKIDQRRSFPRKDDHVVMIASFNRERHIIAVQAGAESVHHGGSGHTDPVIAEHGPGRYPDASTDEALANAFQAKLKEAMTKINKGDDGMQKMCNATRHVLLCMRDAISVA